MQAKYILKAIEALKAADRLSYSMDPEEFGKIKWQIKEACISLEIYSGIEDVEIPIDPEDQYTEIPPATYVDSNGQPVPF